MDKKALGAACAVAVLCMTATGGTYAFLSDRAETARNRFIPGNVTAEIREDFPDGQTLDAGSSVAQTIQKRAWVYNSGKNECYARVSVAFSNHDFGAALSGVDTVKWEKEGDYYYYKEKLAPGESTSELFTGVSVPAAAPGNAVYTEKVDALDIAVYGEAVSVQHGNHVFADYREAWDFHTKNR